MSVVTTASVLPLHSQVLPGHNQTIYQQLQRAVQSTPPFQVWIATCDDLPLQRQLAATLEESLQGQADTRLILNCETPDITQQIRDWTHQATHDRSALLQVLGIEQLTYQGSDAQYQFLRSLHTLPALWKHLGCSLLIWTPRPWLRQIRREVPGLCRYVFEFMGEPTPISAIGDTLAYQATFSPVRRWQFLGKPAPEVPPQSVAHDHHSTLSVASGSTAVPAVPGETDVGLDSPLEAAPQAPDLPEDLWQQLEDDLTDLESLAVTPPIESSALPLADLSTDPEIQRPTDNRGVAKESGGIVDATTIATDDERPIDDVTSPVKAACPLERTAGETVAEPTQQTSLEAWVIAHQWRDRVQSGDHSPATLETAIRHYEQLQPEQATTPHRTEVLNDLGSLYWLWAQHSSDIDTYGQRLTYSSALYEAAMSPVSIGTSAEVLNRIHSNLGSVYSLLATQQEPIPYLSKAVRAFHRALQYAPVEEQPETYATLQTHLGTAYWSLAQHTQEAAHLHRAITAYQEALRQSQPQTDSQPYAQLQNNLGIALWSLSRHERPVFLLEQAIVAYRTALAYRTLDIDSAGFAATQNNLGTAYWDLGGHHAEQSSAQQQAWQQAIAAYETAILAVEQVNQGGLSFDLWATHHSVGVVYDQLAIILAPNIEAQQPLLVRATPHYIKALVGWQAINANTTETAFQALVRNLHLQARYLGIEAQQRSLSQVPADWLPEIWRKL
jgi:tetratricopeptide (TPR) repeat protein